MVTAIFMASQLPDGSERIALVEQVPGGLLRKASNRVVPKSDWSKLAPDAGLAAIAAARAAAAGQAIVEDHDGLVLPAIAVARLEEADAHALGLPPATPFTLQLKSSGSLADGTIAVQAKWIRRGGTPVRATLLGARLREGERAGRVVDQLRSAFELAGKVNASIDADGRRSAFAELRAALGDDIASGIEADGFINRIRIAYAANFSLDAKTSGGRFDFDPVLFGRQVAETVDGDLVDETEASLLTAQENITFQTRFRTQDGARRSYLMPDGTLLFLDPLLGRALALVRAKQQAPSSERRDFLRAPQRHLREALALDAKDDDAAADRLFVETRQFSERVSGIEVWHKPVLPWIKPKPNSWLPEAFGLRVGTPPDVRYVALDTRDAKQVVREVNAAMARGDESVWWKGESLPATAETCKSAESIAALEREVEAADSETVSHDEPPEPLQTFFLQVGQNFETLDYARLPRPEGITTYVPPPLPGGIVSSPKPHQLDAFAWLTEAWSRKLPGVLLADDMGLGKTFQSLMFLRWLRAEVAPDRPILIVAPTGLLRNWQAEIAQHLTRGALGRVVEAFGSALGQFRTGPGNDIRGGTTRLDVSGWDDAGIVLTTYETMRDYHMSFARLRFAAIIYDEAQKLKNPASQMTRAAKALNADLQLAMTGTPVENRLQDLWSIADTIYPGFLGTSREFETAYPSSDRDALQALQSLIIDRDDNLPPFMLRRMKDEILTGLPTKTAQKYLVEMPPAQAEAYDHVLARARALRQSGEKGAMLKVLHMLRGRSLHPFPPRGIDDVDAYIGQSARLKKTFDILEDVSAAGEKALIFCEDLEMQAFLAMAVQERFTLRRLPACISGEVPGPRRQEMVSAFQSAPPGFDVMILSPKAGGVGLTITAANHVIHLSRWWNPAVEDQATDRAYRIGQSRPVTVHLPIATHPDPTIGPFSFDHRLDALMERKRELSRGLLVPPEGDSDIDDLLSGVLDGEVFGAEASRPAAIDVTEASNTDTAGDEAVEAEDALLAPETETPVAAVEPAGVTTPVPEMVVEPVPEPSLDAAPAAAPTRPILSARETPLLAGERRTPSIRRVEYLQHGIRDWAIFDQYLDGADIVRLEIQDPYCCADDAARGRLVSFVVRFRQQVAALGKVDVIALDADSVNSSDYETSRDQRQGLEGRWRSARSARQGTCMIATFVPRSLMAVTSSGI